MLTRPTEGSYKHQLSEKLKWGRSTKITNKIPNSDVKGLLITKIENIHNF